MMSPSTDMAHEEASSPPSSPQPSGSNAAPLGQGGDGLAQEEMEPAEFRAASPDDNDVIEFRTGTPDENEIVGETVEGSENPENLAQVKDETPDPNLWTLPPDKETCTLEEIRRGQVINRVAPNECPVVGCGKKINEASLEPSPGTIASGLRTHVLFVHYANRKGVKKRKLGWSNKRRSSASPKKQFGVPHPNMHSSSPPFGSFWDQESGEYTYYEDDMVVPSNNEGANIYQRNYHGSRNLTRTSPPGSLLSKKIKQLSGGQDQHQSSLQSLMQATGSGFTAGSRNNNGNNNNSNQINKNNNNGNDNNNGNKISPQNRQKGQDLNSSQKNFNQTTSSLFSILAGLANQPQQQTVSQILEQQLIKQQQEKEHHQPQHQHTQQRNHLGTHAQPRNAKAAHSGNTISVSQCSKNNNGNYTSNNPPMNSSLLSLLNEKISGNVSSALQTQLRKSNTPNAANRSNPYSNQQQNMSNHELNHYNNGSPINEIPMLTLNQFIESVARKTGSNIGPAGTVEARRIIERFTSSLLCNSQTIADHFITPLFGEAPQQKPEISASDVILAYKMMQKSHSQ